MKIMTSQISPEDEILRLINQWIQNADLNYMEAF